MHAVDYAWPYYALPYYLNQLRRLLLMHVFM